jgi:hypothetical protein
MIPHGPNTPRWLFPGRVPGQPIDGHSLTNLLNRHGISARPARNGALSALAADLPAAILADCGTERQLPLHPAGGSWLNMIRAGVAGDERGLGWFGTLVPTSTLARVVAGAQPPIAPPKIAPMATSSKADDTTTFHRSLFFMHLSSAWWILIDESFHLEA